jgi:hypothetical protein
VNPCPTKKTLLLVKANHKLKPKEFYAKLHGPLKDLGIEVSSKPNSYPKQIERLKKQAQAYLATLSRKSGISVFSVARSDIVRKRLSKHGI